METLSDVAPPSWREAPPLAPTPSAPLVIVTVTGPESKPEITGTNAKIDEARARIAAGDREAGERLLTEALRDGSLAAADALDALLRDHPERSPTLLKIRRHAVELAPGDLARLEGLRIAARADQNQHYARAIEHVQRAFDPTRGPLAPPPLSAQSAQPGMLGMLARHSAEPAGETFACLWEGARNLFGKPLTAYGTSGLARVQPGPTSTVARLYEVALRLLDPPRFALFHEKGLGKGGRLGYQLALLESPSAVLQGEAADELELKWVFGRALASVLPENALPLGLPEEEGRVLWRVLVSAFGPARLATPFDRTSAAVADRVWQTLTPRAQRRIAELLARGAETPFDLVVERARQSGRRVGLFLTGDFGFAARAVLAEHPELDATELTREGGVARLCAALPALADLFRLAVRPEYADARWHVPAPQSQRFAIGSPGGGGLPVI